MYSYSLLSISSFLTSVLFRFHTVYASIVNQFIVDCWKKNAINFSNVRACVLCALRIDCTSACIICASYLREHSSKKYKILRFFSIFPYRLLKVISVRITYQHRFHRFQSFWMMTKSIINTKMTKPIVLHRFSNNSSVWESVKFSIFLFCIKCWKT